MTLTARDYKPGLGKREASLIAGLAEAGKRIFTVEDARRIAGAQAKEVIRWLVRKKWVLPLRRGLYSIVPLEVGVRGADAFVLHNFVIASMLVAPYYIGYWSSLNYHGLTEQIPRTTFVATTKARHSVEVLSAEYCFVKLSRRKFFGWDEVDVEGYPVRIASPEKSVADCLDRPDHCGGIDQIARALYFSHKEISLSKVVNFAPRMGNRTILKRLGHILQVAGLLPRYEELFAGFQPSAGFARLDLLSPAKGKHDTRWNLLVNYRMDPEQWKY